MIIRLSVKWAFLALKVIKKLQKILILDLTFIQRVIPWRMMTSAAAHQSLSTFQKLSHRCQLPAAELDVWLYCDKTLQKGCSFLMEFAFLRVPAHNGLGFQNFQKVNNEPVTHTFHSEKPSISRLKYKKVSFRSVIDSKHSYGSELRNIGHKMGLSKDINKRIRNDYGQEITFDLLAFHL